VILRGSRGTQHACRCHHPPIQYPTPPPPSRFLRPCRIAVSCRGVSRGVGPRYPHAKKPTRSSLFARSPAARRQRIERNLHPNATSPSLQAADVTAHAAQRAAAADAAPIRLPMRLRSGCRWDSEAAAGRPRCRRPSHAAPPDAITVAEPRPRPVVTMSSCDAIMWRYHVMRALVAEVGQRGSPSPLARRETFHLWLASHLVDVDAARHEHLTETLAWRHHWQANVRHATEVD